MEGEHLEKDEDKLKASSCLSVRPSNHLEAPFVALEVLLSFNVRSKITFSDAKATSSQ